MCVHVNTTESEDCGSEDHLLKMGCKPVNTIEDSDCMCCYEAQTLKIGFLPVNIIKDKVWMFVIVACNMTHGHLCFLWVCVAL